MIDVANALAIRQVYRSAGRDAALMEIARRYPGFSFQSLLNVLLTIRLLPETLTMPIDEHCCTVVELEQIMIDGDGGGCDIQSITELQTTDDEHRHF